MIQARQPHQGLEALMRALAASEAQQLYPLRRTCLAVLADVMVLSLGMPSEARALLDEILPQALADENGERRAYVHLVEAKYFISTKDLYQARMSLRRAALDYERTETWKDLASCLYMEARVAHALHDATMTTYRLGTSVRKRSMMRRSWRRVHRPSTHGCSWFAG